MRFSYISALVNKDVFGYVVFYGHVCCISRMFRETSGEYSVGVLLKVLSIFPSRNHADSLLSFFILRQHLPTLHETGVYEEYHMYPLEIIIEHYFVCPDFLHTKGFVFPIGSNVEEYYVNRFL